MILIIFFILLILFSLMSNNNNNIEHFRRRTMYPFNPRYRFHPRFAYNYIPRYNLKFNKSLKNNWNWNIWKYLYPTYYYPFYYLPTNPGCDGKACGGYCNPYNSKCCGGTNPSTCGLYYCNNNKLCD